MRVFTKNLQPSLIPRSDVFDLQKYLQQEGFGTFIPTGIYGPKTQSAIAAFQRQYMIKPALGNFGSQTRLKINLLNFPKQQILHDVAVSLLGVDASPQDRAVDEYACADTVNCIFLEALGREIGGTTSTAMMLPYLEDSTKFTEVTSATPGTIVISPTEGPNIGHVAIAMDSYKLMSNSSATGLWTQNYTVDSWRKHYVTDKKLTMRFFNIK